MKKIFITVLTIARCFFSYSQDTAAGNWMLVLKQPGLPDQIITTIPSILKETLRLHREINGMEITVSLTPAKSFLIFRAEAKSDRKTPLYFSMVNKYRSGVPYNFNGEVTQAEIYRQSPHDVNAWIVNDIAMQPVPVVALKNDRGFSVALCGSPVLYDNYTSQEFYPDKKWMALCSGDNGEAPGKHPDSAAAANISYNKEKTQIFTPGRISAHYQLAGKGASAQFEGIIFQSHTTDLRGLRMDINQKAADFFSKGKYTDYFGSLAFTTAYMNLRVNETGKSNFWVVPSVEYANTQYCRDAFWISMMLTDSMSAECLKNEMDSVNSYAEYPLMTMIWAYRSHKKHIPVDYKKLQLYLDHIETRVREGYYYSYTEQDGRQDFQYWGDLIAFEKTDVVTYNQGLLTLALFGAREMGLKLKTDPEKALALYRGLFNNKEGFYPISKMKNSIVGPDPVLPDLLAILYLGHSLLPDENISSHYTWVMEHQKTAYGLKILANPDGSYLSNDQYDIKGYISQADRGNFSDGQYFRGGSFFLYDEIFLIDAYLHGIKKAADDLIWRTKIDFAIGATTYECLNTVTGEAWKPNMGWNVAVYAIWRSLVDQGKASGRLFNQIDLTTGYVK